MVVGWGATCSYNFDSLLLAPCLPRAGRRDDAYDEERETEAIALEKDRARAEEGKKKKERRKYPRGRREERDLAGADVNWRKCRRGHTSPTSICLVIVYRYNG